jgi:hypothetical protein
MSAQGLTIVDGSSKTKGSGQWYDNSYLEEKEKIHPALARTLAQPLRELEG